MEIQKAYSDKSFWKKIKSYGVKAGRKIMEPALSMYYCMKDDETPTRAKVIIVSALAYFIIPTDLIFDLSPVIGFTDDLTAILTAFEMVRKYVKPEHKELAQEQAEGILRQ